jgi:hypothetical protein
MYNKDHGTITMSQHVAFKHFVVLKQYKTWLAITTIIVSTQKKFKMLKKPFIIFIVDFFNFGLPCKNSNLVQ